MSRIIVANMPPATAPSADGPARFAAKARAYAAASKAQAKSPAVMDPQSILTCSQASERIMPFQHAAGNVLVVDDNAEYRATTAILARLSDCMVTQASNLDEARRACRAAHFDLIMIDLNLPDGNGLDLLDDIDLTAHGKIAVVTGYPTVESAMRAVRSPIVEYLLKPVDSEALSALFADACKLAALRRPKLQPQVGGMVGESPPMLRLFERIRTIARLDVSVLISGESGTGKELVARALHDLSGRNGRFIAVNCGAVATELMSSQLFGHERGAFTGALQTHAGYFEQAEGGTLLLDEITEMPLPLQVYLLRILESGSLTRVGGTREIPTDVRVIALTNRDPEQAVAAGLFRADLYYRLLEFPLSVPTLSERREDIPLLAQHFVDRLNERYHTVKRMSPELLRQYVERPWPGNVRELRHNIQRAYILAAGVVIEPQLERIPEPPRSSDGAIHFRVGMTFEDVEHQMLLKTLSHHGNNKRQAARALGITAKTIYNRLLRYRELGLISDDQVGEPESENGD
ncbi:MAG TPA: sigma-54 dependent transcriptional regulator [Rudaea sp.]